MTGGSSVIAKAGPPRGVVPAFRAPRRASESSREAVLPNRRTMELVIVTVVLLHPVIRMAHIWAAKHLITSNNQSTGAAAEVVLQVV